MAQINTDTAVLAKEAGNFGRISDELKSVLANVESTASALAGQWRGFSGHASQDALARYKAAAEHLIQHLKDILDKLQQAGVAYHSTDEDQASQLAKAMLPDSGGGVPNAGSGGTGGAPSGGTGGGQASGQGGKSGGGLGQMLSSMGSGLGGKTGGTPGTSAAAGLPKSPSLKPASAGGGGTGGGAGGGARSPLQPPVAAKATAPSPTNSAAHAAAGARATANPVGGAAGGGMGGMPMGAHGGQGQGSKERRRSPALSPDERLYDEDRPWSEGVVGAQRRKDVPAPKESK
jgi:WXG100 family type VII secretion target